jgi:hypothetical protein
VRRTWWMPVLLATAMAVPLASPATAEETAPEDPALAAPPVDDPVVQGAALVPVTASLIIETQAHPGPNDPNRCIVTRYIQFTEVAGATRYVARYRVVSNGTIGTLGAPPYDDVLDYGPFHSVAPPGTHRLAFHSFYSTGRGCEAARAVASGVFELVDVTATVPDPVPPRAVATVPPPNPGDAYNCTGTWTAANNWFWTYAGYYGDVGGLDSDGDNIPCETLTGAPSTATLPTPSVGSGYWMLEQDAQVYGFGDAWTIPARPAGTAVAIVGGPGGGYWVLTADGVVHGRNVPTFGNVDLGSLSAGEVPTTIAGKQDGTGYWVFTNRGRALPFGSAGFFQDMRATPLNGPIVGSAVTPSGNGYWMVGSDGGIFSFGDAAFSGSTGNLTLNRPVVGIAPDPDGAGYWLVASDGGIFAFDAAFRGSVPQALAPGAVLNQPVIGALAYGNGYLMVARDGGIFSFSDLPFLGSLGGTPLDTPVVGVAVVDR